MSHETNYRTKRKNDTIRGNNYVHWFSDTKKFREELMLRIGNGGSNVKFIRSSGNFSLAKHFRKTFPQNL